MTPTQTFMNNYLATCFRANRDSSAGLKLYQDMIHKGYALSSHSYHAVMNYIAHREPTRLPEVVVDMEKLGHKRTTKTYNLLIKACGHLRTINRVNALECLDNARFYFKEMQKYDLKPDINTMNALLSVYERCQTHYVDEFYNEILKTYQFEPNIGTDKILLKVYIQQKEVEKVFKLFEKMEKKHSFFDLGYNTYRLMISFSARFDHLDLGIRLLRKILDHGILPKLKHVFLLYKKCENSENPEHKHVSQNVLSELFRFGITKKPPFKPLAKKKKLAAMRLTRPQTWFSKPFSQKMEISK